MTSLRKYLYSEIKDVLKEHEKTHNLIPVEHPNDRTCLILYEEVEENDKIYLEINDIIQLVIGNKYGSIAVASDLDPRNIFSFKLTKIPMSDIMQYLIFKIKGTEKEEVIPCEET